MKILKNILILFTSFFTLALFSALSVFFIETESFQKPIVIDVTMFSKISLPVLGEKIKKESELLKSEIELIEIELTKSYQKEAFAYIGAKKRETAQYKEVIVKLEAKEEFKLEISETQNKVESLNVSFNQVETGVNEINNNQLIKHYGFENNHIVEGTAWANEFEKINLLAIMNNLDEESLLADTSNKEDSVSEGMASLEKEEAPLDESWEKEMVFIDYAADEIPEMNTQEERIASLTDHMKKTESIPSSVLKVINRETDKRQAVSTQATIDLSSIGTSIAQATTPVNELAQASAQAMPTAVSEYSRSPKKTKAISRNTLMIYEANIDGVNTQGELRNFEFNSEILSSQRLVDDMAGKIVITEKLNQDRSVLRGTILKHGFMRTKLDIVLEPGEFKLNIPLIPQATFSEFLDKEGLVARGGFLLIEMPKTANNVTIDRTHEAKVYLDRRFQVVEDEEDYEYVLFVGVSPGNVLISYTNFRGQKAEKITHIVEDEVLYEGGGFILPTRLNFKLTQKNMLGMQSSPYNIYPESLNFFNTDTQSQQTAVGSYTLLAPPKPHSARNYIEVREGRIPLFIGMWKQETIELPSETFAQYILDSHQLRNLENACMIQVNLSKTLSDASVFGETEQGQMGIIQTYLDQDGQFNYDASEMASHLFLVGDSQGAISLKLNYLDGTTDIIQTFCSNNTYLVEQL